VFLLTSLSAYPKSSLHHALVANRLVLLHVGLCCLRKRVREFLLHPAQAWMQVASNGHQYSYDPHHYEEQTNPTSRPDADKSANAAGEEPTGGEQGLKDVVSEWPSSQISQR